MGIVIKPSDLKYRYPKDVVNREGTKFRGKPDPAPFNRHDLYDILPMMAAVMNELGSEDDRVLHLIEDILNNDVPRFIATREEVFDCLVAATRDCLGWDT